MLVIYLSTLLQIKGKKLMAMTLHVVIPPHPLIGHWLSILRIESQCPISGCGGITTCNVIAMSFFAVICNNVNKQITSILS